MCNKELIRIQSKIKEQNVVKAIGIQKGEKLAGATMNLGHDSRV